MGIRGKARWRGAAATALAALALGAADAGAAEPKVERLLSVYSQGQASNGYRWELVASRSQPGGAAMTLQFREKTGSASYVVRRPARVSKHRLVSDFGDLGRISMRFRGEFRDHESRGCFRNSFGVGSLQGGLHFDGERDFTRVNETRVFAYRQSFTVQGECRDLLRSHQAQKPGPDSSILSSCDGEAGAGFFAAELAPETEAYFLATKTERSPRMSIIRTLSLEGPARSFDVQGPRRARVAPPLPLTGRGEYRENRLEGVIKAQLPGTGTVRFSPGEAELESYRRFEPPKCLPPEFAQGPAPTRLMSADTSIDDAVADFVLSRGLRSLISR